MYHTISYTGFCLQGSVKKNNEDNICCMGEYLPFVHTDEENKFSGNVLTDSNVCFAVFDGLGGEDKGEIASCLAARSFSELTSEWENSRDLRMDYKKYSLLCQKMNKKVLSFAKKNSIRSMGSTVAGITFAENEISGFNLGDSRCYRLSSGRLEQLSKDHTLKYSLAGRVTQCLGMREDEYLLDPDIFTCAYKEKDIYLLCTDGLTKLMTDNQIERILSEHGSIKNKAVKMKNIILRRGVVDDTSILLFQIDGEASAKERFINAMRNTIVNKV